MVTIINKSNPLFLTQVNRFTGFYLVSLNSANRQELDNYMRMIIIRNENHS